MDKLKKIKPATYIRTTVLVLALINQLCHQLGLIPLPAGNEELYTSISWIITALAAITAWWKNNSFTDAAVKADEMLKGLVSGISSNAAAEPGAATGTDIGTESAGELLSEIVSGITADLRADSMTDSETETETETDDDNV